MPLATNSFALFSVDSLTSANVFANASSSKPYSLLDEFGVREISKVKASDEISSHSPDSQSVGIGLLDAAHRLL